MDFCSTVEKGSDLNEGEMRSEASFDTFVENCDQILKLDIHLLHVYITFFEDSCLVRCSSSREVC